MLNRFGGLYVDVDMECLRPHDALHATSSGCSFYAGFSHTGTVELNNGVIGWVGLWGVGQGQREQQGAHNGWSTDSLLRPSLLFPC